MKKILSITGKELKLYFGSPMALIFVGVFLVLTLFVFFWVDSFFRARRRRMCAPYLNGCHC